MKANHWTMYSNEYTLLGGERSMADVEVCTKQFVTSILFRNPVRRLASNLRYLMVYYKHDLSAKALTANRTDGEAAFFRSYANANASFWERVAPGIINNYYIRALLGEAVWHEPLGSLNATHHLRAARLVLMQYDIVVPTESPKALASRLLAYGAGWPVSYTDVHDQGMKELQEWFHFDVTPYMPSDDDMSYLNSKQALDMELYELAVLIGQLDYLVYETAAAWNVVPWEGMPATIDPAGHEDDAARYWLSCGLMRGPRAAWSQGLVDGSLRQRPNATTPDGK
ncbi:hypothetical protein PLESTB_001721000 [Pleodorina starrii]|uniref:Uncharacterized protein n=1 Tax=Pleodorina starrii TaxID=330485 RepID=A0A9W6BZI1_9CHLO|nr:hypothetical protein PLESTB_001721000 [Pleodorina starrii]GLC69545.1 hypothetical protein PLESTF_000845600 [Pleodorina starrii]